MEGNFKLTPLAAALALVLGSPLVMAQDPDQTSTNESDYYTSSHDDSYSSSSDIRSFEKNYKEDTTVKQVRDSSVSIKKKIDVTKDLDIRGEVAIGGRINVNSAAMAVVDGQQLIHDNVVTSSNLDNNAEVTGSALSNAQGNIGVNVAAGDANAQENAAALAAADAGFVFGAIDAEVFNQQEAKGNSSLPGSVYNGFDGWGWGYASGGNDNTASLDSDALTTATGNIGVNIAAGNFNGQRNSLAAATGVASLGEANVSSQQQIGENETVNQGSVQVALNAIQVQLGDGSVDGNPYQTKGSYSGKSDQIGDVYPDTWTGDVHPDGSQTGHIDLDSAAQGAQDLNQDGGALAFNEAGDIALDVELSGWLVDFDLVIDTVENNASISGNALQNATGNIGVNVVAGTNNLQSNSLAVVSLAAPRDGGNPGGGEPK